MPDALFPAPDLALVLGPADTATFVAEVERRDRLGRTERDTLYAVVHRGHGLWTHVYRINRNDRSDRMLVHVEKIYEGDRLREACTWAAERLDAAGAA